jgi:hypothetical protein
MPAATEGGEYPPTPQPDVLLARELYNNLDGVWEAPKIRALKNEILVQGPFGLAGATIPEPAEEHGIVHLLAYIMLRRLANANYRASNTTRNAVLQALSSLLIQFLVPSAAPQGAARIANMTADQRTECLRAIYEGLERTLQSSEAALLHPSANHPSPTSAAFNAVTEAIETAPDAASMLQALRRQSDLQWVWGVDEFESRPPWSG